MQQYHHADPIITPYSTNSVWIGDLTAAQQTQWLKQNKIKTVITAAEGVTLNYDKSILHIHYKLKDNKQQNVSKVLEEAADKIDKSIFVTKIGIKQGGVLVHCGAGVSRSTTLVIGYLIKYHKMSFLEALRLAKSKRSVVCPNLGFQLQLKSFEKLLKSRHLVNSLNQRNLELPQIQKSTNLKNNHNIKLSNHIHHHQSQPQSSNYRNVNFGGGFVKKLSMMKRQNSLVVANKGKSSLGIKKNNHLQNLSNGFQEFRGGSNHQKQLKDLEYIKKIAMFRFGVTNTEKWKLG